MKKSAKRTAQKALIAAFAILLCFSLVATDICMDNANAITGFFNQQDYIIETMNAFAAKKASKAA